MPAFVGMTESAPVTRYSTKGLLSVLLASTHANFPMRRPASHRYGAGVEFLASAVQLAIKKGIGTA